MLRKFDLLLVAGIILLAVYLRFYRINDTFIFSGEVGDNILTIKNAFFSKQIPLIGPPTSHPWLYFGPLYYWIYGLVLIAFKFNPFSHAYFGALVSVMIVIINYFVIRSIFNRRIAVLSSLLITVSPLFLDFARSARFYSIVTLLVYPFIYLLYKICQKKKDYWFFLGLTLGSMFSFHFTPLVLVPFAISVLFIKKISIKSKQIIKLILGLVLPMITFLIFDLNHGFSMTKNILLWVPYRIAGFFGLYPKNTISLKVISENILSVSDFFTRSVYFNTDSKFSFLLLILFITILIWYLWELFKKRLPFSYLFVLLWFFWGIIAVFIHGSPPIHYFVPILPLPILIMTIYIDQYMNNKIINLALVGCLLILIISNFNYYFTRQWFYPNNQIMTLNPYYLPFTLQQRVVLSIIKDAHGQKFNLKRIGLNDQFVGNYAQNYQYLLWLNGNQAVSSSHIAYTICEPKIEHVSCKSQGLIIKQIANITIYKNVK
jgi:4-amino-4-deoxy-L-arabinose transferase-like glycosyltransferase